MPDPPNGELQYYTGRCDGEAGANVWVRNGMLTIQARKESFGHRDYTSGRLKTQGRREFRYGYLEAAIKLPKGTGLWPAV